jgi:hypothetical protein
MVPLPREQWLHLYVCDGPTHPTPWSRSRSHRLSETSETKVSPGKCPVSLGVQLCRIPHNWPMHLADASRCLAEPDPTHKKSNTKDQHKIHVHQSRALRVLHRFCASTALGPSHLETMPAREREGGVVQGRHEKDNVNLMLQRYRNMALLSFPTRVATGDLCVSVLILTLCENSGVHKR